MIYQNSKLSKMNDLYNYVNSNLRNQDLQCVQCSIGDTKTMHTIFEKNDVDIVIHLASFKNIDESKHEPLKYYENNVCNTVELIKVMEKFQCYNLVFSSCCSLYSDKSDVYYEDDVDPKNIQNPYSYTKYIQENIFKDIWKANKKWSMYCLRFFEVIGYLSYLFKDDSKCLMNELYRVYAGYNETLSIDKTNCRFHSSGDRDYIHVLDLAYAHVCICSYIKNAHIVKMEEGVDINGVHVYNIGSGKGVSQKELIKTFEMVNKCKISHISKPSKHDEYVSKIANVDKIYNNLGWKAKFTLEEMVKI